MHKPTKNHLLHPSMPMLGWAAVLLCTLTQIVEAGSDDITIGVIAGITGPGASYGANMVQGAEMAVRDANAAGGINGRKLKLKIVDDASEPARSAIVMRRLIAASPDVIVGGWGSAQVLAHMDLVEQSAIPYIVVNATHPDITSSRNKWIFRVIQTDSVMADYLAKLMTVELGKKRIAVIFDSNAYGSGARNLFVESLKRLGAQALEVLDYQTRDQDFSAQLQRIKTARPDAIVIFGTVPAAPLIMKQARALAIEAPFFGLGGLANDALISQALEAAEGTRLMSFFNEDSDTKAKEWSLRYRKEFSTHKYTSPPQGAWQYLAIRDIVTPCLRKVDNDRVKLRECIAGWRGHLFGIESEVYFNNAGQLVQPPLAVEVRQGEFRLLKTRQ